MTLEQAEARYLELYNRWLHGEGLSMEEAQEYGTLRYDIRHTCRCGKLGAAEDQYDARGIYLGRWCGECWKEEKKKYRPEVLTDPDYWADEPIEEDEW